MDKTKETLPVTPLFSEPFNCILDKLIENKDCYAQINEKTKISYQLTKDNTQIFLIERKEK